MLLCVDELGVSLRRTWCLYEAWMGATTPAAVGPAAGEGSGSGAGAAGCGPSGNMAPGPGEGGQPLGVLALTPRALLPEERARLFSKVRGGGGGGGGRGGEGVPCVGRVCGPTEGVWVSEGVRGCQRVSESVWVDVGHQTAAPHFLGHSQGKVLGIALPANIGTMTPLLTPPLGRLPCPG